MENHCFKEHIERLENSIKLTLEEELLLIRKGFSKDILQN